MIENCFMLLKMICFCVAFCEIWDLHVFIQFIFKSLSINKSYLLIVVETLV